MYEHTDPDSFSAPAGNEKAFREQYELKDDDTGVRPEFFKSPQYMPFLTKQARDADPAAPDVIHYKDFVKIVVPGNEKMEFIGPVNEQHLRRFARQWALYQQGQSQNDGTALEELKGLMPEFIARLKTMHIHNLEGLSQVNDVNGPNLGMGWRQLREDARIHLTGRKAADVAVERIAQLEAENAKLRKQKTAE